MSKQYFLMKMKSGGLFDMPDYWVASEKLDGRTAFWDGGITTGMPKASVPWANMAKDARFVDRQIATGLWSSNANVIHAPYWWLAKHMPAGLGMHMELWCGRGKANQQRTMSITAALPGAAGWDTVQAVAYDIPWGVFDSRHVDTPFYKKYIDKWVIDKTFDPGRQWWNSPRLNHRDSMAVLRDRGVRCIEELELGSVCRTHWLDSLLELDAEGAVIRDPMAPWIPQRTSRCVKVKPFADAEAVVTGVTAGEDGFTGMIGALSVRDVVGGTEFLISSGLTFEDRRCSDWIGRVITYRYRTRSASGVPVEARYMRERSSDDVTD